MRSVRLTYDDVGDAKKVEKDRTLMLRPIVIDRTRPVVKCCFWNLTGNDRTLEAQRSVS